VRGQASWPNLFVVGAAKAGTTSLWRYLGAHPAIFMARIKEPHFFSQYDEGLFPVVHDQASYLRLFASARTPLRGEASPSYLWNEAAAARIKRVSPRAKILIALRDPVERMHALYWHRVRVGLERASFADAFDPGTSLYARRGRCAADVRRFLRLFGPDVQVLVFEELVRDTRRELAAVFGFLGVDPAVAGHMELVRHNRFALPRNRVAAGLLASAPARRAARRFVPHALRAPIEDALLRTGSKPPLDPDLDRSLTAFFRPDVRELEAVLGRALPWARWSEPAGEPAPLLEAHAAR
jgi:Sulfotransferase domain